MKNTKTRKVKRRISQTKARSARPLISASTIFAGFGQNGARPRPWNYWAGVRQFVSWAYAAATINANGSANVPLRMYIRKSRGQKSSYEYGTEIEWLKDAISGKAMLWKTKPVDAATIRYFMGKSDLKPSQAVIQKAIAFGGDIEELTEIHPALEVLQTVNPWCNGYELSLTYAIDVQLTGNHYEYVVTDAAGKPLEYWRMPPQWTCVVPDNAAFIKGYTYGMTPNQQFFSVDDVDHYKMVNPDDIYYGKGWLEAAWSAVSLHNSRREEDQATADNYSRPDWLLSARNGADPKTLDRLEKAVEEKLRGTDKRGRFLTASGDITATALNWQIPEKGTPTRIIEEIAAVSGVPVAMLLSNDPNRATALASWLGWMRNTVAPYCRLREEKLNERHLKRYPDHEQMFLAHDPASFEDRAAEVKHHVGLVAGGIETPNEARQALRVGLPRPEGDRLNAPAGTSGGASALAGDLSPGQNDERRDRDDD